MGPATTVAVGSGEFFDFQRVFMFRPWKGVLSVALVLAALPAGSAMAQSPDVTAPAISVVTPTEDAVYTRGQPVIASYTCTGQPCSGPVPDGAAISTATAGSFEFKVDAADGASATRRYTVVDPAGVVSGDAPATLDLTLGTPTAFAPFIPGVAKEYTTSLGATLTSTAADATLWVADASATATGRLVNGTFALEAPLQVSATSPKGVSAGQAPVGGSAAPTKLLTYAGPLAAEAATLTFKQAIGGTEGLRTGGYSKTLTFTLSTTTP